ncbi:RNA polymerase III subunit Rpc34, partial [Protomyces lactucae-debilis]
VTQQEIVAFCDDSPSVEQVSERINEMLKQRMLEISAGHDGSLLYTAIGQLESKKRKDMNGDEEMVYQYIKASGNEGIWLRNLKLRTNLHTTVISKTLKNLEAKSLVKCVKSVQHPTRKIYMLYDLVPSIEISGGPWYTDGELDTEFVSHLLTTIETYLLKQTFPDSSHPSNLSISGHARIFDPLVVLYPSVSEIKDYLHRSGVVKDIELEVDHVRTLLDVLRFDGKITRTPEGTWKSTRTVQGDPYKAHASTEIPCGRCPVSRLCTSGTPISPETCVYWAKYL